MDWAEATDVLRGWAGGPVVVVPFLAPGISVRIGRGDLIVEDAGARAVRVRVAELSITLYRATFIEAGWIPGREGTGLSLVQGGTRIDVFAEG